MEFESMGQGYLLTFAFGRQLERLGHNVEAFAI